jgi:hypothetical protein
MLALARNDFIIPTMIDKNRQAVKKLSDGKIDNLTLRSKFKGFLNHRNKLYYNGIGDIHTGHGFGGDVQIGGHGNAVFVPETKSQYG